MKIKRTIYQLSDEEVRENPFINTKGKAAFYNFIADILDKKDCNMDCTKIDVADNISESWFNYVKENGIDEEGYLMLVLDRGPKTDSKLGHNEICIHDGFFIPAKQTN